MMGMRRVTRFHHKGGAKPAQTRPLKFARLCTVVVATLGAVTGCQANSGKATKRFVEANVTKEVAWSGGPIDIINIAAVTVTADPSATQVKATARMSAMAFSDEKSNADQSIAEAKDTFTVEVHGNGVNVKCGHGGDHGSSKGEQSGCESLDIVIPAGRDAQKIQLKVVSEKAGMTLTLASAVVTEIDANANGGTITASLPATKGGNISLVAAGDFDPDLPSLFDITAELPADFAADSVVLQGEPVDKGSFIDITGDGRRGTAGTGLASLKLTSTSGVTLASR